ncbi:hypothetical protein KCTCHS21_43770 [Cohnella abietis]|uniref:Uncharacterized protein n=2 Tax=Cohnella abietis TaxID=2507935 RepID=A0A3T1DAH4_9BACL|nr:hypothetical protein KCTCHS21_43770 [Cohnella abietis]
MENPEQKEIMSSADPVKVTFEVQTVWKGQIENKTVVNTAVSGASCGYTGFALGAEYVVYAYGNADKLETGMCERTKLLESADEDITELGTGYDPIKTTANIGIAESVETGKSAGIGNSGELAQASGVENESATQGTSEMPKGYYIVPIIGAVSLVGLVIMLLAFRRKR